MQHRPFIGIKRIHLYFSGCGPGERQCIKIYAPICGSDRKTYGNRCWFDLAKRCDDPSLTIEHKGKCVGTFYFISKDGRCYMNLFDHIIK